MSENPESPAVKSTSARRTGTRGAGKVPPARHPSATTLPHTNQEQTALETRSRNPERTRSAILEAAIGEFSARGFAGGGIDAIALRSGANKRMIYHYFGNKRGLWLAVLETVYERVRTAELGLHLGELDPQEAMRTLVGFTFDSFVADRIFINLLNSENLHQARHLKESSRIRHMHSPLIDMIRTILARGEAAQVFRPGIDPAQLWITIAGISFFYFSNIFTLSVILDRNLTSQKGIRERRAHVIDIVLLALRPI